MRSYVGYMSLSRLYNKVHRSFTKGSHSVSISGIPIPLQSLRSSGLSWVAVEALK